MLASFVVIGIPFVVAIPFSLMRGRGLAWAFLLFPTLAGAFALVAGGAAAYLRGGRRSHAVVGGTATGGLGIALLGLVVGGLLLTFGLTDPNALYAGSVRDPSYLDLIG